MRIFATHGLTGTSAAILTSLALFGSPAAHADLRDDIARCAGMADDTERLACFDTVATDTQSTRNAAAAEAEAALKREFRFDPGLMTGPLSFRIAANGGLIISRDTAVARDVEKVVSRVAKALGDSDDWNVSISVHGGRVTLSRGSPYTGDELVSQVQVGMTRTGLPQERYTIIRGTDAEPILWDDGRVRHANEHVNIEIVGFGAALTR